MKKPVNFSSIAMITIMAICTLPALSQGGPPPGGGRPGGPGGRQWTEDDVKERVKRQTQALDLSAEQEKKLTDYEIEMFKKNQVLRQKNQGDWEKMREEMMKQREERNKKYEEILTPEQYKKFQANQEQRRKEMQERRQNYQGQPGQPSQPAQPSQNDRPQRGRGRG